MFADEEGVLSWLDHDGTVTPIEGGGGTVTTTGLEFWDEAAAPPMPGTITAVASFTPGGSSSELDGYANVAVALVPSGTGGVLAAVPDGTQIGGNARGAYAIDLQLVRDDADQVAAPANSAIIGGGYNKIVSNTDPALDNVSSAIVGGEGNEINSEGAAVQGGGINAIVGTWGAFISGYENAIVGGARGDIEDGADCFLGGGYQNAATGAENALVGGAGNSVDDGSDCAMLGGVGNTIDGGPDNAAVIGGHLNFVYIADNAAIVGGYIGFTQGENSAIVGGYLHYIESPQGAILGGYANNVSAENGAVAGGKYNKITGAGTFATGFDNDASGQYALNFGVRGSSRGYLGVSVQGINVMTGGSLGNTPRGVMQAASYMAFGDTTNATPTVISATGAGGTGAGAQVILPNDSTFMFTATIVARRTDADNESAAYKIEGCIDRNGNAASTALVGTVTKTVIAEDSAAWDVAITADTTNGGLTITVTGEAAKTIRWVAKIETVEVVG